MSIRRRSSGQGTVVTLPPSPAISLAEFGHLEQRDGLDAADVQSPAVGLVGHRGGEKGLDRVVDIGEVAKLRAVAETRGSPRRRGRGGWKW